MRKLKNNEWYTIQIGGSSVGGRFSRLSEVHIWARYYIDNHASGVSHDTYTINIVTSPRDMMLSKLDYSARKMLEDLHDEMVVESGGDEDLFYFSKNDVSELANYLKNLYNKDIFNHYELIVDSSEFKTKEENVIMSDKMFLTPYYLIVTGENDKRFVCIDNSGDYTLGQYEFEADLMFEDLDDAISEMEKIKKLNCFPWTDLGLVHVTYKRIDIPEKKL